MLRSLILFFALGMIALNANSTDRTNPDRMEWFHKAKFGMFIHWGLYSQLAGEYEGRKGAEWIQYQAGIPGAEYAEVAKVFNPTEYSAKEWVTLAKEAGMKYIVITTKHHDGFCMYDSKLTNFDIVDASPYGKDPMKELAEECRRQGLRICFYYSVKDWHHRNYPIEYTHFAKPHPEGFHGYPDDLEPDYKKYMEYLKGQVTELLQNYGPVSVIWFDWHGKALAEGQHENRKYAEAVVERIRELQPDCLINPRLGNIGSDFTTPEQHIPGSSQRRAFEVCMTLNDNWCYVAYDHNWKSTKQILYNLCDIASKGGNFLLNVGPDGKGVIPQPSLEILTEVGQWLQTNGEAIYGTIGFEGSWIRWNKEISMVTRRISEDHTTYYIHIFDYPGDQKVYFPGLTDPISEAYMLADSEKSQLKIHSHSRGLMIHLPEEPLSAYNNVVVVKLPN
jgi:alpha-L-fucosidase